MEARLWTLSRLELAGVVARRGVDGVTLGNYLLLVDYTGRLYRQGKAEISRQVAAIFDRLGTTAENWQSRLEKLREGHLFGRFVAATRQRLREVADRLGMRRLPNLAGRPAA